MMAWTTRGWRTNTRALSSAANDAPRRADPARNADETLDAPVSNVMSTRPPAGHFSTPVALGARGENSVGPRRHPEFWSPVFSGHRDRSGPSGVVHVGRRRLEITQ